MPEAILLRWLYGSRTPATVPLYSGTCGHQVRTPPYPLEVVRWELANLNAAVAGTALPPPSVVIVCRPQLRWPSPGGLGAGVGGQDPPRSPVASWRPLCRGGTGRACDQGRPALRGLSSRSSHHPHIHKPEIPAAFVQEVVYGDGRGRRWRVALSGPL